MSSIAPLRELASRLRSLFPARPGSAAWLARNTGTRRTGTAALALPGKVEEPHADTSHPDYTETILVLRRGRVCRGTIRSRLPFQDVQIEGGRVPESDIRAALGFVGPTVSRCAPWVGAVIAPRARLVGGDRVAGYAVSDESGANIILCADQSLEYLRTTVHHEIWHQVEYRLSDESLRILRECLSPYAYCAGLDDYNRSYSERLARAYSYYAAQADDLCEVGFPLPGPPEGHLLRPVFDAFAAVYSGDYARALRQNGSL